MSAPAAAALPARFRVADHVVMRRVDDELLMLNLANENYYGLNEVGARVMQLAETGISVAEAVAQLAGEFDVGTEQLEADVSGLARELLAAGLIEGTTP